MRLLAALLLLGCSPPPQVDGPRYDLEPHKLAPKDATTLSDSGADAEVDQPPPAPEIEWPPLPDAPPSLELVRVEAQRYQREIVGARWKRQGQEVHISRGLLVGRTEVTAGTWAWAHGEPKPSKARLPQRRVSWFDAIRFANTLSEKTGLAACYSIETTKRCPKPRNEAARDVHLVLEGQCRHITWAPDCGGYRLPTEAEWMLLAGAGKTQRTVEDLVYGPMDEIAMLDLREPTSVRGGRKANAFGLYDTVGSVFEWVWDAFGAAPRAKSIADPINDFAKTRVRLGGAYRQGPVALRKSFRVADEPDNRLAVMGLRLVRLAPAPELYTIAGMDIEPLTRTVHDDLGRPRQLPRETFDLMMCVLRAKGAPVDLDASKDPWCEGADGSAVFELNALFQTATSPRLVVGEAPRGLVVKARPSRWRGRKVKKPAKVVPKPGQVKVAKPAEVKPGPPKEKKKRRIMPARF